MRTAAALIVLVGCQQTPEELFAPDELHLWSGYSVAGSTGSLGHARGVSRVSMDTSGDSRTFGVGLTWRLTGPGAAERAATASTRRLAGILESGSAPGLWPSLLPRVTPGALPPVDSPITPPTPAHEHTHAPAAAESAPSSSSALWTRLVGALTLLVTSIVAVLNRERIPLVRRWAGQAPQEVAGESNIQDQTPSGAE